MTQASGPIGSGSALPSSGSGPSNAPPTAAATPSQPANTPASRDRTSSVAGQARSGPPASTTRREHPNGQLSTWPFDGDDRPSGSVQPLSQADPQAILAHLNDDPDRLLTGTSAGRPVVAVRVRASVG